MASKHGIGTSLFMQHHHHTAPINNRPSISQRNSWAELNLNDSNIHQFNSMVHQHQTSFEQKHTMAWHNEHQATSTNNQTNINHVKIWTELGF